MVFFFRAAKRALFWAPHLKSRVKFIYGVLSLKTRLTYLSTKPLQAMPNLQNRQCDQLGYCEVQRRPTQEVQQDRGWADLEVCYSRYMGKVTSRAPGRALRKISCFSSIALLHLTFVPIFGSDNCSFYLDSQSVLPNYPLLIIVRFRHLFSCTY